MPTPCDQLDRDLFATATRVRIGDGNKAKFWESNWLGDAPLRHTFPLLFAHSQRKQRSVAQALDGNKWVADLRHRLSLPILEEFRHAWRMISLAPIELQTGVPESITWILTKDGQYSTKSAYRIQFEGRARSSLKMDVWRTWGPPKHKFFAWLLFQDRLWCADRLQRCEWPNNYFCPLCMRNLETSVHLMIECPFAKQIWHSLAGWEHCEGVTTALQSETGSISAFRESWMKATPAEHRKDVGSLLILICWSIWRERNAQDFQGQGVLSFADFLLHQG
jgi:hypothetical protein